MTTRERPAGAQTRRSDAIATVIRGLTRWHGVNQEHVARAVGMSPNTLTRRMNRGGWEIDELVAIAALFRVPITTLIDGRVEIGGVPPALDYQAARDELAKQAQRSMATWGNAVAV